LSQHNAIIFLFYIFILVIYLIIIFFIITFITPSLLQHSLMRLSFAGHSFFRNVGFDLPRAPGTGGFVNLFISKLSALFAISKKYTSPVYFLFISSISKETDWRSSLFFPLSKTPRAASGPFTGFVARDDRPSPWLSRVPLVSHPPSTRRFGGKSAGGIRVAGAVLIRRKREISHEKQRKHCRK
jgi:hypothetical protein